MVLSGCSTMPKAEPFYPETGENVEFKAQYEYYFSDESNVFCTWVNNTEGNIFFKDTFQLHELGDDGEWYLMGNPDDVEFKTDYAHFVEPGEKNASNARYEISLFTGKLDEGKTYRISTYYYDEADNHYQIYAEFICDNNLAETEMLTISDGMFGNRDSEFEVGTFEIFG